MKEIVNDRINRILNHDLFIECINKNEIEEKDRKFCRHNMGHFLDVARLAMIFNLQEQLDIPRDIIYAAALLHDIGRFKQYQDGVPHEKASAALAPEILVDCGYDDKETCVIVTAINNHRNADIKEETPVCITQIFEMNTYIFPHPPFFTKRNNFFYKVVLVLSA